MRTLRLARGGPTGLRTSTYWDGWRWPAVFGGGAMTALGIPVLAIRRPDKETTA